MSFYTFVLYDKHFRLALSTCGEHKWTNNAYIAKLHFIYKYDNRSVETIHHKAGGAGPGPPISLWNIWKVIKWLVHDEYMILKITKVICKHAEPVYLNGTRAIECGHGGADCDTWWKLA